ncbi:hypothetical protein M2280_005548 [Prescottella agglutinans]|uniref:Restriction endonuclease type IV Mrr domain-containing protein n=1 Tax=Prescottella agglutinans TaxID=1644129 RepID=A0ABT6MJ86_9NOCA|nr:hypothetical protein [Prescottella agglutinans]
MKEAYQLPPSAEPACKRARGRAFEHALVGMFEEDDLEPRASIRPSGEEIDGSLWLDGRTYLFEAKWTADRHPASSLYQFKGKIDGKLTGTIGLFFSMSGYSEDAVDALKAGKEINLLLFDRSDVDLVAAEKFSIADAIRLKLRAAAQYGNPFAKLEVVRAARKSTSSRKKFVFVEGKFDQRVLRQLQADKCPSKPPTLISSAGGPLNMASSIEWTLQTAREPISIVVILEDDQIGRSVEPGIREAFAQIESAGGDADLLRLPVPLEDALDLYRPGSTAHRRLQAGALEERIATLDIGEQVGKYPFLADVLKAIGVPVP